MMMSPVKQAAPGQRALIVWRPWMDWALLAICMAAASLALRTALVGWRLQAALLAILFVASCAGAFVASLTRVTYPDGVLFGLVSFAVGIVLLSFAAFVLAHRGLFGEVPLAERLGDLRWGFVVLALPGCAALWKLRRSGIGAIDPRPVAVLLTAATCVWLLTQHGFYDASRQVKEGRLYDREAHVVAGPSGLLAQGLPHEPFQHRGLELLLIQFQGLLGEPGVWNRIAAFKVLSLAFYFTVAYATYAIGRFGFGATRHVSVIAGASSLVFGAIYPTFWSFGDLSRSTYLGFYSPGGSLYHNATQLFSHGIAAVGLALIGLAWKQRAALFGLGCILIAASTFFKPSFIFYFGPAMFAMLPILIRAGRVTHDLAAGLGALILAPAAWFLYPAVMHIARLPIGLAVGPLSWSASQIPVQWDYPWLKSPTGLATFVVLTAFAFPISALLGALSERRRQIAGHLSHLWQRLAGRPFEVLMAAFFGISVVGGLVLSEPGQITAGNYSWGTASAYLCALPGLAHLTTRRSSQRLRWAVWLIYAWQVASGLRHLVRFAVTWSL